MFFQAEICLGPMTLPLMVPVQEEEEEEEEDTDRDVKLAGLLPVRL
jgi:hypothetical protein